MMCTKTCTRCREEKPLEAFSMKKAASDGRGSFCRGCAKVLSSLYYENNREKLTAIKREIYAANPEKARTRTNTYYKQNSESIMASFRVRRDANPAKHAANQAAWATANQPKRNAINAKRRASKLNATPAWANHSYIEEVYKLAALRTKLTKVAWQVDHIIPLQGKLVCGLHVEDNLQVILMVENVRKGNRFSLEN